MEKKTNFQKDLPEIEVWHTLDDKDKAVILEGVDKDFTEKECRHWGIKEDTGPRKRFKGVEEDKSGIESYISVLYGKQRKCKEQKTLWGIEEKTYDYKRKQLINGLKKKKTQ